MGSSGGGSYKQPNIPKPPSDMIAGPGQTSPFNPSWINFLGDTNIPSTGLTPDMLQQIDSGSYLQPQPGMGGGGSGDDRGLLAQIMARLDAMQNPQRGFQPRRRFGSSHGGGYSTSGREGAGGFGSRSSSASRAGGGLY